MTETNEKVEPKPIDLGEYKYGFRDDVTPVFSTGKGISEDVVRAMSAEKEEPEWMLEFRLKSLETFNKMTGKMFLRKSRKLLNVLVFQKQNVPILLEPQLSMSQKWFTTI